MLHCVGVRRSGARHWADLSLIGPLYLRRSVSFGVRCMHAVRCAGRVIANLIAAHPRSRHSAPRLRPTRRSPVPVRRASRSITLVLIGSAASLAACSPDIEPSYQRDHYASIEDCAADWGRPESCEPAAGSALSQGGTGGGTGGGYYYRGPIYSSGYRNNAQAAAREQARSEGRAISNLAPSDRSVARSGPATRSSTSSGVRGSSPTARGGFGSSSRSFSSGG